MTLRDAALIALAFGYIAALLILLAVSFSCDRKVIGGRNDKR